jgi:hypothetical protein
MPYPIYEYEINMILNLPIRRGPGAFMNMSLWEDRTHKIGYFGLTNLLLFSSCNLPFQIVGLKYHLAPISLYSVTTEFIYSKHLGKQRNTCPNSSEICPLGHYFYPQFVHALSGQLYHTRDVTALYVTFYH